MKSYILNFATYDLDGEITSYDYETATELWLRCDELNEHLHLHTVELTELPNGSIILSADSDEDETPLKWLEELFLAPELERIADEFCGFELPSRRLLGERELNELILA